MDTSVSSKSVFPCPAAFPNSSNIWPQKSVVSDIPDWNFITAFRVIISNRKQKLVFKHVFIALDVLAQRVPVGCVDYVSTHLLVLLLVHFSVLFYLLLPLFDQGIAIQRIFLEFELRFFSNEAVWTGACPAEKWLRLKNLFNCYVYLKKSLIE